MAYFSLTNNAIAWGQVRLRGGWRNVIITIGTCAVLVVGLILLCIRVQFAPFKDILYGWTMALLGVQIAWTMLAACGGIQSGIRRDVDAKIIESHRLMPISDMAAVLGYIVGSSSQAMVGAGLTLIIGMVTATAAGIGAINWLAANGILLVFAVVCSTAIAMLSFQSKGAFAAMIALLSLGVVSGGVVFAVLPGLTLLCAPAIGNNIFGIIERGIAWNWTYLLSFCMQFVFAGLFFLAAARKFRRDYVPAFGWALGIALLLAWVVLSVSGILAWPQISSRALRGVAVDARTQIIASTIGTMLLALVPISSAAWQENNSRRRRALRDPAWARQPASPEIITVLASLIVLLVPLSTVPRLRLPLDGTIACAVGLFAGMMCVRFLLGMLYLIRRPTLLIVGFWLVCAWAGPPVLDAIRYQFMWERGVNAPQVTALTGFGPVGLMMAVSGVGVPSPWMGAALQILTAAVMSWLYRLMCRPRPVVAKAPSIQL